MLSGMKILLAVDGSPCSDAALRDAVTRPWAPDTEVQVVSVIHATPIFPELKLMVEAVHYYSLDLEQKRAHRAILAATKTLEARAPHLRVTCTTMEGSPAKHIVDE